MINLWRNEDAPVMIQRLGERGTIWKCDFDYQDELKFDFDPEGAEILYHWLLQLSIS